MSMMVRPNEPGMLCHRSIHICTMKVRIRYLPYQNLACDLISQDVASDWLIVNWVW